MSKTKNDQLKIFTSRFPDQGECGGGMIVIAKDLKEAKKKLKKQFKEDNDGDKWDWQEECFKTLEEAGVVGEDDVISFFT